MKLIRIVRLFHKSYVKTVQETAVPNVRRNAENQTRNKVQTFLKYV